MDGDCNINLSNIDWTSSSCEFWLCGGRQRKEKEKPAAGGGVD